MSFDLSMICSNLKCENPTKNQVLAGFKSLGFKVCQTYYNPDLWKTDAPPEAVYDIFKQFKLEFSESKDDIMKNVKPDTAAHAILTKDLKYKPDFAKGAEQLKEEGGKQLRKYFTPTEANWGPKPRATGGKK